MSARKHAHHWCIDDDGHATCRGCKAQRVFERPKVYAGGYKIMNPLTKLTKDEKHRYYKLQSDTQARLYMAQSLMWGPSR